MLKTRIHIYSKVIAALMLITACDKGNIGPLYDGESGFAFASGVVNVESAAEDECTITVPIYRGDMSRSIAEISIEFDSTPTQSQPSWEESDPEGIFTLMSKRVVFPDEAFSAGVMIKFTSLEALGISDKHRIRLTIKDGVSPSGRSETILTVSRKLTFEKYGDCSYLDNCIFYNAYDSEIYKALEAEIYRVIDPYTEGLLAEEYADMGWMDNAPSYVEFSIKDDGSIYFKPFRTGMKVNGLYQAWAYYPGEYLWGRDFSEFNSRNRKVSDKCFRLCAVYCLPDFQYGFLNEGAYDIEINVK